MTRKINRGKIKYRGGNMVGNLILRWGVDYGTGGGMAMNYGGRERLGKKRGRML